MKQQNTPFKGTTIELLRGPKSRKTKVGDKVLLQNPCSEGLYFSKPDPFQPLNVLGVIRDVRPGGMFKVEMSN